MSLFIFCIILYLASEGDEFKDALNEEKKRDDHVHVGQAVQKYWRRVVILQNTPNTQTYTNSPNYCYSNFIYLIYHLVSFIQLYIEIRKVLRPGCLFFHYLSI